MAGMAAVAHRACLPYRTDTDAKEAVPALAEAGVPAAAKANQTLLQTTNTHHATPMPALMCTAKAHCALDINSQGTQSWLHACCGINARCMAPIPMLTSD
eukprot:NODE_27396_length_515_cov_4.152062.p3 GENE.NODE_27396_length_515_cov_4.152062~~NODE_27396_length_515_cov_4.152062.p3  ORF type:complete len:100 (-),score=9.30 NODE_27396_length_515_cov_4.152062:78-377(-)